jgi:hypothetical protein
VSSAEIMIVSVLIGFGTSTLIDYLFFRRARLIRWPKPQHGRFGLSLSDPDGDTFQIKVTYAFAEPCFVIEVTQDDGSACVNMSVGQAAELREWLGRMIPRLGSVPDA